MAVHYIGDFRRSKSYQIFKRDGMMCLACGHNVEKDLTIDHIIPKSKGGTNDAINLQTLCFICNGLKGNKIINYRDKPVYNLKPQKQYESV